MWLLLARWNTTTKKIIYLWRVWSGADKKSVINLRHPKQQQRKKKFLISLCARWYIHVINQSKTKQKQNHQKMSTQSYYKDRLGFDPREALYDAPPVKSSPSRGRSVDNNNHYDQHSPTKKQKHTNGNSNNNSLNNSQGGYEDALTQFKGTMSLWDFFVENWDITGKMFGSILRDEVCWCVFFFFRVASQQIWIFTRSVHLKFNNNNKDMMNDVITRHDVVCLSVILVDKYLFFWKIHWAYNRQE